MVAASNECPPVVFQKRRDKVPTTKLHFDKQWPCKPLRLRDAVFDLAHILFDLAAIVSASSCGQTPLQVDNGSRARPLFSVSKLIT